MEKLKVPDLFSGIGGFSLGLERTGGFETVAFCEIEPFPRKVLAKHWPEVPIYDDVRTLTAERLAADGIAGIDVICGGFPCQDISTAGKGAGLAGERSGLWSEIARLVGELRPSYVIVENVSALLGRGLGTVLGDLAALGYDAEWHCIPASHVGAPHRRDRIWIVANPSIRRCGGTEGGQMELPRRTEAIGASEVMANAEGERCGEAGELRHNKPKERIASGCEDVADADSQGLQGRAQAGNIGSQWQGSQQLIIGRIDREWTTWPVEPELGRVAHGVPDRSHRLKGLGNAVVPKIPEFIGRAVLASINE